MVEIYRFNQGGVDTKVVSGSQPKMEFRHYLAGLQCRRRLSQRALALRSRVDHSAISRLISGERAVSLDVFSRIVGSFNESDEQVYALVLGSLPEGNGNGRRVVNNDSAPILEGSFGEQLEGYMQQRGVSQRALAIKIKVTFRDATLDHSSIARIKSNERLPLLSTFALITYSLGLNPAQVGNLVKAAQSQSSRI